MENYRYTFLLLCLILVASTTAFSSVPQVAVLTSSSSEFKFTYAFDRPASASDEVSNRSRTVQVGIPPNSTARIVSVVGSNWRPLAAGSGSSDRSPRAEILSLRTVRGRRILTVSLDPFTAGGAFSSLEVHLVFESKGGEERELSDERDPGFERIWKSTLANYEQALEWPKNVRIRRDRRALLTAAMTDLTDADQWYQVFVDRTDLIRITGAELSQAGISLADLASSRIRLFNAGGLPLPVDNIVARPTLEEVALLILDGGDGRLDADDQIIFYGEAVNRWRYRSGFLPTYVHNRYTAENVYWLAVSGNFPGSPARIGQVDGSLSAAPTPLTACSSRVWVEQDNIIGTETDGHIWDFYNWYWTDEADLSIYVATPGAVSGAEAYLRVRGNSNQDIDLTINGFPAVRLQCGSRECRYNSSRLVGGAGSLNRLDLHLEPASSRAPPFLNYLTMTYLAQLLPVKNRLDITPDDLGVRSEFHVIDNFTITPDLFDISDRLKPRRVTGWVRQGGLLKFQADLSAAGPNRFYCAPLSEAASPTRIEAVDFTNLRSNTAQTDMIIVTARSLVPALDEYLDYRRVSGRVITVVTTEDIMDNFSFGLFDPTAIRDYLKYAYENNDGPAPTTVLFVGDASYDFLDNYGTGTPNWVPSYIRSGDFAYSDDNYVYFGDYGILDSDGDRWYDMMTARWPVRTSEEIDVIVTKIKQYEATSSFGRWRTRVTLVADDEHTTGVNARHDELYHTAHADTLAMDHLPRSFSRQQIYLIEYPQVNGEKAAVNKDIIKAFNDGALVVNYIGHGNPDNWAHEHVLNRSSDLPLIDNAQRVPLVFAASCDIGFFDDPNRPGMAEVLLGMASGGAIGVVSATRLVYAPDNARFNRLIYDKLFGDKSLSICEAVFVGKLESQYSSPQDTIPQKVDNDRAYTFLGGPEVKLAQPILQLEFVQQPDSLVPLAQTQVRGTVVDDLGRLQAFDGTVLIDVFDSDQDKKYTLADGSNSLTYGVAGPTVFRGSASIEAGAFDFRFVTPLDVGYRGNSARISVYAMFDDIDGLGLIDSIPVASTIAAHTDSVGPVMIYGIAGRSNFISGDKINQDESLEIRLADSSGINLAGTIGHGITLMVDGRTESVVDLTNLFENNLDDYTSGRLEYRLADLTAGRHQLKVKAWDNANNVSTIEFEIDLVPAGHLALHDLLNYPNPMGEETTFYFELTQAVSRLNLDIFTLSGRRIWNFSEHNLPADRYPNMDYKIVWRGRDADGDRVAAGVYLYKVTAAAMTGGGVIEQFGKVVVVN